MGFGVHLVHALAKLGSPFGHGDGETDVNHQRDHRDPGKPHVKFHRQQREHQAHFNQSRDDAVKRIRHQRMHRACTALNVAGHATGLALQMKAQTHCVQMAKYAQRNRSGRPFGGFGKHQLTQLGEQGRTQAQGSICHQQSHRHHQHRTRVARLWRHGVDQIFEQQRHADVGHLGPHHEGQGRNHPPFVLPQIGEQALQGGPICSLKWLGNRYIGSSHRSGRIDRRTKRAHE